MTDQWTPILHEIGTIIGASAAVIAAVSSLKNGHTLKNGKDDRTHKPPQKKTRNGACDRKSGDWYKAPELK